MHNGAKFKNRNVRGGFWVHSKFPMDQRCRFSLMWQSSPPETDVWALNDDWFGSPFNRHSGYRYVDEQSVEQARCLDVDASHWLRIFSRTGMTWRNSGTTLSTMSSGLRPKNIMSCSRKSLEPQGQPRAQDTPYVHLYRFPLHCNEVERFKQWLLRLAEESECKLTDCGSHVSRVLNRNDGQVETEHWGVCLVVAHWAATFSRFIFWKVSDKMRVTWKAPHVIRWHRREIASTGGNNHKRGRHEHKDARVEGVLTHHSHHPPFVSWTWVCRSQQTGVWELWRLKCSSWSFSVPCVSGMRLWTLAQVDKSAYHVTMLQGCIVDYCRACVWLQGVAVNWIFSFRI